MLINFEKQYPRVKPIINLIGFELKEEEKRINLYSSSGELMKDFEMRGTLEAGNIDFVEYPYKRRLSYDIYVSGDEKLIKNEICYIDRRSEKGDIRVLIELENWYDFEGHERLKITINDESLECEKIELVVSEYNNLSDLIMSAGKADSINKPLRTFHLYGFGDEPKFIAREQLNPGRYVSLEKNNPDIYSLKVGKLKNYFLAGEMVKKYSKMGLSKEEAELFMQRFFSSQRIKNLYECVINALNINVVGLSEYITSKYKVLNSLKNLVDNEFEFDPEFEEILKYFSLKTADFKSERNARGLRR